MMLDHTPAATAFPFFFRTGMTTSIIMRRLTDLGLDVDGDEGSSDGGVSGLNNGLSVRFAEFIALAYDCAQLLFGIGLAGSGMFGYGLSS
jgi:hypothetical protein